jgi:hypothetical protein
LSLFRCFLKMYIVQKAAGQKVKPNGKKQRR